MRNPGRLICGLLLASFLVPATAWGNEVQLNGKTFTLADGLTIELAAAAPLTERPICVDFDEAGNLYIAESSGSNEPVEVQLKNRPHSILRLTDTDGDGVFDKRTVFADKFMFPEGCAWHDGSLYVAAPPQIWKLTDKDGDGVAEKREVWFDGKTLTGCANDLHGPYSAPDGQLYWCKGAFAEQTYERSNGKSFVTRASHIFRHDPRHGFVEPVLTGGMDNPVGIAFTRAGDPILTCTFLHQPSHGLRDGLIHAVYGGLWGKKHGVLEGHPRTGDLMPPLAHLGAAAMAGIARIQSGDWDAKQQLLACSFNLHKVTRHVLTPKGATFEASTEDWLKSDDVDFHPTDVIEDADGSILVVDTGGWYKLCCPTSQLHKPDVRGAIYRIRVADQPHVEDPRGKKLDWKEPTTDELIKRLDDNRFVVRDRATAALAERSPSVADLANVVATGTSDRQTSMALWALTRINTPEARQVIRDALPQTTENALKIAIRSTGLWRDGQAADVVRGFLDHSDAQTARLAAAALGRMDDAASVPALLACAGRADSDRFLFHAATYALIEIGDPEQTRTGLAADAPGAIRAALWALDQMPSGKLAADDVVPLLDNPELRETALSLAVEHPEWGPAIASYLQEKLTAPEIKNPDDFAALAATIAGQEEVRSLLAKIAKSDNSTTARQIAFEAMAQSGLKTLPAEWGGAIAATLRESQDKAILAAAITAANTFPKLGASADELRLALLSVAESDRWDRPLRLQALRPAATERPLETNAFNLLLEELSDGDEVTDRLLAADILFAARLKSEQFQTLAGQISEFGPMELNRVLLVFEKATDPQTGERLVAALEEADAAEDLPVDRLKLAFSKFGEEIQAKAKPLFKRPKVDASQRAALLEARLKTVAQGDPRRGQAVFQSSKAACSSCHAIGYGGGNIGPDLTRIGNIRTERDLLEAILYPSASFVRSYEPVTIVTSAGQVFSGIPKQQEEDAVTLVMAADKEVTIPREEIEVMQPSKVSIMPAGLEKQLTEQELADLVMFLESAR